MRRRLWTAVAGIAVAASAGGVAAAVLVDQSDRAVASTSDVSADFLDLLAPIEADAGARADEQSRLLLAATQADSATDCMNSAAYSSYADLPVRRVRDFVRVPSEFTSGDELLVRGLVTVGDPALDAVPIAASQELDRCLATDTNDAAKAVNRFIVFRDGEANPFGGWHDVVRDEIERLAANDAAEVEPYRQCFRDLGVPTESARSPVTAMAWLVGAMNRQGFSTSAPAIEAWQRGEQVLDSDAGAQARAAALCLDEFAPLLTDRLHDRREDVVRENRALLLDGQTLFNRAIGERRFDPASYDFRSYR